MAEKKSKALKEVIELLQELHEDVGVPKNVKIKLKDVINILQEKEDISIRINKVLHELDEIANDVNMQPYTRTQIWNVVSLLEKI